MELTVQNCSPDEPDNVFRSLPEAATLYKYRPFDQRALEILINRELWFAKPESLNDPLDCRIPLGEILQATIDSTTETTERRSLETLRDRTVRDKTTHEPIRIHEAASTLIRNCGVLSLSKCEKDALMWSHYGGEHRGICIGFAASFFLELDKAWEKHELVGMQEVEYRPTPPFQHFFTENAKRRASLSEQEDLDGLSKLDDNYPSELIISTLLAKSDKWAYENEFRVVAQKPHLLKFPASAVKEVIFGTQANDGDIATARNVLSTAEWHHIQYKKVNFQIGTFEMLPSAI